MNQKKAVKLTNLCFNEGSFVDDGANPEAHIKLFKAKQNYNEKHDSGIEKSSTESSGKKPIHDIVTNVDKINGGGSMSDQIQTAEVVQKTEYLELQKQSVDLKKQLDNLQVELKKEQDSRLDREFLDKASAFNVPGMTQVELRDLLKAVSGNVDVEDKMDRLLKSASQVHKHSSVLTKQLGNTASGAGGGDAWGEIQALAKAKMQGNPKLDMPSAIAEVTTSPAHADLYDRYQWERAAKMRGTL